MAGVLGIHIDRDKKDGKLTLIQTGFIDSILSATNLEYSNLKFTPVDEIPLHNDFEGEDYCET